MTIFKRSMLAMIPASLFLVVSDIGAQCREYQALDPIGTPLESYDVAIEGTLAVYGVLRTPYGGTAAYFYRNVNGEWLPELEVRKGNGRFGSSISISNGVVAIGAPGNDSRGSDAGAVFIYRFNGFGWSETALFGQRDGANYGHSVSLDGDLLCVGSIHRNGGSAGTVMISRFVAGVGWTFQQGITGGGDFVDCQGDLMAKGYSTHQDGVVDIYRFDGNQWNQEASHQVIGAASASLEGDLLAVGAPTNTYVNGGSIFLYRNQAGSWPLETMLTTVDQVLYDQVGLEVVIKNGRVVTGTPGDELGSIGNGGALYSFEKLGNTWTQTGKFRQTDTQAFDELGTSVDMDGSTAIASIPGRGLAHVFSVAGISLDVEPSSAQIGDTVELSAFCGPQLSLAYFALVGINGLPTFTYLGAVQFGQYEEAVISSTIPPGTPPIVLTLQAFKFENGMIVSSDSRDLTLH